MENFFKFLLIAVLVIITVAKKSYDGHEVLRVNIKNTSDMNIVMNIVDQYLLDVWSESKSYIDIHVNPEAKLHVQEALSHSKLQYDAIIPNIGKIIRKQEAEQSSKSEKVSFYRYNSLKKIESFMHRVALYNKNATLKSIGKTVQGRNIWQLKFSVGSGKPAVWFDCNIHAREWITGATCVYGVNLLSKSYGSNRNVRALLDKYDVYIIPIMNPDGYAYTWSNDRLWRKNRKKYNGEKCYGVDLNRNFDDHFGGIGSSGISCSQIYRGPSPASEPETKAIQAAIINLVKKARLKVLFSIHSYSQLWMHPHGWSNELPKRAEKLKRVSSIGIKALTAVHGTKYKFGPMYATIYPISGNTIDFAYKNGIFYSFTLELRDKGRYGFLLPENQIHPTSQETWAGLLAATLAI